MATPTIIVTVEPTFSEQGDYEAIEAAAQEWIERGYEPTDSEPGEWLQLTKGESIVEISLP